jgi:hypothetical protein
MNKHQKNMQELQAKRKEAKANLDAAEVGQQARNAYQDLHLAWRKAVDGPKDAPKK